MATKKQEIKRLLREDYGYPVLQCLLAELVYETRGFNTKDLSNRYNSLLKILLGPPKKTIKKKGYKNDKELLSRAAVMTKACYRKDPKTGKRLKRFLTISEACEEIARLEHVKGYEFQTSLPDNIRHHEREAIRSTRLRLIDKLKDQVSYYGPQHFGDGSRQAVEYKQIAKEIRFIKSLIPDWLERMGCQVRFEKK